MQYPTISGDTIVFTYEGDLWSVPAAGGDGAPAHQPPGHRGSGEVLARREDARLHRRVRRRAEPLRDAGSGRRPRRLTYFGAGVQAVAWTPDGKKIVFRSSHEATLQADDAALHGVARRRPARGAPDGPRHPLLLLARRHEARLQPPRHRGVLLEALQGRAATSTCGSTTSRSQPVHAADRLRRQERVPDVRGRPAVLRVGPRREGRQQPLHHRPGHQEDRAGDEVRRLRHPVAVDRRPAHRLRAGRPAHRLRPGDRRGQAARRGRPVRPVAAGRADGQPARLHPDVRGVERRQDGGVRGARRRLPRARPTTSGQPRT